MSPEATFWMAWGLFAAVFGARLVLAPYWLHRENQAESTKLATNLQSAYEQIADRTAALEDARAQLAEAKIPPSALPQLRIEYEKADHLTRHPSGVVEAKFLIRNDGPGLAKRVRVKVESVVPKARRNKAKILAYASQFAATKLKVVRESLGFELQPGEVAEVKLIRAANDGEWYWVDGYDIDNKESEFRLPRSRYHITVVATSHDGGTDRRVFRVTPKKNGEIDVNLIHPKPVDSNPATQS